MRFGLLALISLLTVSAHAGFDTQVVMLDGPQLCAFYQEPNGCYQKLLQLVQENSKIGKISQDKRSCEFPDGSSAVFDVSMEWMLKGSGAPPQVPHWNFTVFQGPGKRIPVYQLQTSILEGRPEQGFFIKSYQKSLSIGVNYFGYSPHSEIESTYNCYFGEPTGPTEYVITHTAVQAATALCPSVLPTSQTTPGLNNTYTNGMGKTTIGAYLQRIPSEKVQFFSCRNY